MNYAVCWIIIAYIILFGNRHGLCRFSALWNRPDFFVCFGKVTWLDPAEKRTKHDVTCLVGFLKPSLGIQLLAIGTYYTGTRSVDIQLSVFEPYFGNIALLRPLQTFERIWDLLHSCVKMKSGRIPLGLCCDVTVSELFSQLGMHIQLLQLQRRLVVMLFVHAQVITLGFIWSNCS